MSEFDYNEERQKVKLELDKLNIKKLAMEIENTMAESNPVKLEEYGNQRMTLKLEKEEEEIREQQLKNELLKKVIDSFDAQELTPEQNFVILKALQGD